MRSWMLCCCSVAESCLILCDPMDCSMPGFPVLPYLLEFAQTNVHWVCDAIKPSHPVSSPSPIALNFSQHQCLFPMSWLFASGGQSTGASASAISPPSEYSGLISFRIDWFDFLAVQGTLKSLLQYHSSKASTFWHLVFFLLSSSHISTWLLEKP